MCSIADAPHVIRPNPQLPIPGTALALTGFMDGKTPKLLDRIRQAIRVRHYSRRTEEAYVYWIRRYIVFHGKVHPAALGAADLSAFLSWLAEHQQVSASTQNQALSAAFLESYKDIFPETFTATQKLVLEDLGTGSKQTIDSVGERERVREAAAAIARMIMGIQIPGPT